MVAWYWLLVVAFVTFPIGFCLFALFTVDQVSSDSEAAHYDIGTGYPVTKDMIQDTPRVGGETPIARAAREASEVGKESPARLKQLADTCRLLIKFGTGDGIEEIRCRDCPGDYDSWNVNRPEYFHCACAGTIDPRCAEGARLWLSSHGIDPDAEIEAAR